MMKTTREQWRALRNYLALGLPALLLAACGSAPKMPASETPRTASTVAKSAPSIPSLPKAGSGKGAYYKDDGPGDNPPEGLEFTVDPIPVVEAYSKSGNKPYAVFGKTYTPITDTTTPFVQRGIATWYGKKFHGQKTSSGELYDMYKITAAHPTLPIPSYARVTNLANGKQIIVRINDRGPFHSTRIIDLSYTAALKLGYLSSGSSQIEVERLLPQDIEKMAENRKNQPPAMAVASASLAASSVVAPAGKASDDKKLAAADVNNPGTDRASMPDQITMEDLLAMQGGKPVEKIATEPGSSAASGYYLQFGAYALKANAESIQAHLQAKLENRLPAFDIVRQGSLYRLVSGPFASKAEAVAALAQAGNLGIASPLIVQR
ncbi:septal ring lytic transglycosylase RlpA family protein [Undibacterium sp.]|uniref:septal ring lytic transglycosylase RlpA family protein n=1 Tax=Undibacterium sp. TaxID=1914977 RepID=UPI002CFBC984|nr:septal ring lytic transglycosylase RlpA family protein [Undibacterium sp.]HTD07095.1 septal ring lytic transglycosylase RlpA family protein [Undibacterium sp.]